jgi:peptide chain release factor subunit 3
MVRRKKIKKNLKQREISRKYKALLRFRSQPKKEVVDIEAALKDKTKYDVVVDEKRAPLNIVFIGHVDAGKSTICGNILLLTGQVDQNDVRKLQIEAKEKNRESWYLAYIMDINEEEKAKGKTVEVGKARFDTENKRFTILDAPGHKNYVPNMIAGASQADVAALVISAKTGEFESGFDKGGQTREHAMLAKALGVQQLVVVINKMDEVDWAEKRFLQIQDQLIPFLKSSCGYDMDSVIWVPIAGLLGENMKESVKNPNASWYKGKPLFDALDLLPLTKRDETGPIRIPVLDKYKEAGASFAFGKVESGTIVPGLSVTILPLGEQITIHAIYNNDDVRVAYAKAGEGVKLHIKGIDDDNISRGDVICSNWSFTQICNVLECEINILELPEHKPIMSSGYTCVMHLHSALEDIFIKDILAEYDKEKNAKTSKFLRSGSLGLVRIQTMNNPICCEKFETMPQLGRFTLRDEGKTIATGQIKRVKSLWKD